MSNIQKAFKNKAKLGLRGFANGGQPFERSQDLGASQPSSQVTGPKDNYGNSTATTSRFQDMLANGTGGSGVLGQPLPNSGMAQGLGGGWSMATSTGGAAPIAPVATPGVTGQSDQQKPAPLPVASAMQDMNNLGKTAAAGLGAGASYGWNTKSASELAVAGGRNPNLGTPAYGGKNRIPAPVPPLPEQQSAPMPDVMAQMDSMFPSRRGYADGGMVGGAVEGLRGTAKRIADAENAALGAGAPQAVAPAPKVSMGSEADNYAAQAAKLEAAQLAAAKARMAAKPKEKNMFGFAEGGKIQGPGTATSDSIPAEVEETGEPIRVANGERIVSTAQDKVLEGLARKEGYANLEEMLEAQTGKPVGPTVKHTGLRGAANGMIPIPLAGPEPVKKYGPTPDAVAAENLAQAAMSASLGDRVKPGAVASTNDEAVATPAPTAEDYAVKPNAVTSLRNAERNMPDTPSASWLASGSAERAANDAANSELGARVLGPDAAVPTGLRGSIDASGGRRLDFTSANNAANDSMGPGNGLRQANGEGVASMRQKDGSYKNVVLGASPTRWEDGQQYKDAWAKIDKDKEGLRQMQRDRFTRDMGSDIKNSRTIALAQANLGQMDKDAALAVEKARYGNELEFKKQDLGLRRDQNEIAAANMAADNQRANRAQQEANAGKVSEAMNKLLETYVPTDGLKGDDLAEAQGKRSRITQAMLETYGGQLPPDLATFNKDATKRLHQARLTEALNSAVKNRGVIDKARNLFNGNRKPTTTQDPNFEVGRDGWTVNYGNNGGVPLWAKDVLGEDGDLMDALKERVAQQQKQKGLRAATN